MPPSATVFGCNIPDICLVCQCGGKKICHLRREYLEYGSDILVTDENPPFPLTLEPKGVGVRGCFHP